MRNIALKLMYNGTAYHGWQVQKNAVTVCETLQKALEKITGAPVHLTGCGRTDAGVHAERYIANFRTESRIPLERLPFAINTHTPEDIAVSEALEVAEDFNAIGSCLKKEYTYRIYNSRVKNPFYVNRAYFYPKRLDEEFLNRAAHQFVGTHDFAAVRSVGTETKTTVRTIYWCDVTRSGELLELKVCADGFLYVLYVGVKRLVIVVHPANVLKRTEFYLVRSFHYEVLYLLLLVLGKLPAGRGKYLYTVEFRAVVRA